VIPIEESNASQPPILPASTAQTVLVDWFPSGPTDELVIVTSIEDCERIFGPPHPQSAASYALHLYFLNGGRTAQVWRIAAAGKEPYLAALSALASFPPEILNLLCLPGAASLNDTDQSEVYAAAEQLCEAQLAFLLVDIPESIATVPVMLAWKARQATVLSRNAACYFPRLVMPGPNPRNVANSGAIAGIYARIDRQKGIWKSPAGTDAGLVGATLAVQVTDADSRLLNSTAINALRRFPNARTLVWGARTLAGDGNLSDFKYVPVRRLALLIEQSLATGTEWASFEVSAEPLWAALRLQVSNFLHALFMQGAFQGRSPQEAYFVKCDATNNTLSDQEQGRVNILIAFAPLRPAEFVIVRLQQLTAAP